MMCSPFVGTFLAGAPRRPLRPKPRQAQAEALKPSSSKKGEAPPLCAPPPSPSRRERLPRVPPQLHVEGGRHQRALAAAFPPVPCRRYERLRQGTEPYNGWPDAWFPVSGLKCQYENARVLLPLACAPG